MFCPQCGHKNDADYRFCGGCGAASGGGTPTQASAVPPPAPPQGGAMPAPPPPPPPPVTPTPPPVYPPAPPVGTGGMPPTMRFEPPPVYPTPPVASPRGGGGGGAMVMLLVAAVLAIGGLAVWKIGEHSRSDPSPSPSVTASESPSPTVAATGGPTGMPTTMPTGGPGGMPTGGPGDMPSGGPGGYPTSGPGGIPTDLPTVPGAQTSVMLDQVVMCDAVTGTGAPVNTVQAYGPRQNFYVSMKAFNLRVGTWIVGAFRGPGFTRDLKLDSNRQGNYYCWFKVEPPAGAWVPGTYQAFIVVDGTLKNTLTFQVTP